METTIKTIKKFNKNSYVCPHCKEKQKSICRWETCSVEYEYAFATKNWEQQDICGGDFECWVCPSCEGELNIPKKMLKQII